MKTQTNTSTPGLEGYTKHKRLAVWQAAHKQLLCDDSQYRKRFHSYLATVICLSCVLLLFYLPFFGVRLFGFSVDVSIILGVAAIIVCLTLRQFYFQKQNIVRYLQSSHDA
jgi:uncharacterized membrane protein (DUF485 family)